MPHHHSSISFRASWNDAHRCAQLCAFNFCASFLFSSKIRLSFSLPLPPFCRFYCSSRTLRLRISSYFIYIFSFPVQVPVAIFPQIYCLCQIFALPVYDEAATSSLIHRPCHRRALSSPAPPRHPSHTPTHMDLRFQSYERLPANNPSKFLCLFFLLARACFTA